jgi:phosphoribosyl 1,2-cyclic phosphodiesterase
VKSPIAIYASPSTHREILRMFQYMEDSRHSSGHGFPPFSWHTFSGSFFIPSCENIEVTPLPVQHGRDHAPVRRPYVCMGFRIQDFSYISDVSFNPEDTRRKLYGTRILVLNALREKTHPSHFSFSEVFQFMTTISATWTSQTTKSEMAKWMVTWWDLHDQVFNRYNTWHYVELQMFRMI